MVNNPPLHKLNPRLVASGACAINQIDGRDKISNGPVYDLAIAHRLVSQYGLAVINTSARDDMANEFIPEFKEHELKSLILALRHKDHYVGSERCATTNGITVDSDGYRIFWNRTKNNEWPKNGQKIYVKFGFRENMNKCLVVSIHPS